MADEPSGRKLLWWRMPVREDKAAEVGGRMMWTTLVWFVVVLIVLVVIVGALLIA